MRIWDQMPPDKMCDMHFGGEWFEIWGLFRIAERGFVGGYANHPETRRWVGRTGAIYNRMKALHAERLRRGLRAKPLPEMRHLGNAAPPPPWDDQLAVLRAKGCTCEVP